MSHGPEHGEGHHEAPAHGAGHGEATHGDAHGAHGAGHGEATHGDAHGAHGAAAGHGEAAHGDTHGTHDAAAGHGEAAHGDTHGAHGAADGHGEAAHGDTHGAHGAHGTHGAAAGQSEFAREAHAAWERAKHSTGGWLMAEKEPVQEVSFLKTPFYIIRDWVKASVGNVLRRGKEVVMPAKNALESAWNTVSKPFTAPAHTLFHPIKYLANIPRIATATVRAVKNLYKAPLTGVNEAYQEGIQNPIERVGYKLAKVPPKSVTSMTAGFSNKVANVLGWPLRAVDGVAKWATNWWDDVDDYFGAATQGAH